MEQSRRDRHNCRRPIPTRCRACRTFRKHSGRGYPPVDCGRSSFPATRQIGPNSVDHSPSNRRRTSRRGRRTPIPHPSVADSRSGAGSPWPASHRPREEGVAPLALGNPLLLAEPIAVTGSAMPGHQDDRAIPRRDVIGLFDMRKVRLVFKKLLRGDFHRRQGEIAADRPLEQRFVRRIPRDLVGRRPGLNLDRPWKDNHRVSDGIEIPAMLAGRPIADQRLCQRRQAFFEPPGVEGPLGSRMDARIGIRLEQACDHRLEPCFEAFRNLVARHSRQRANHSGAERCHRVRNQFQQHFRMHTPATEVVFRIGAADRDPLPATKSRRAAASDQIP